MTNMFAAFKLRKVISRNAGIDRGISQRTVALKYREKIVVPVVERPAMAGKIAKGKGK